MTKAVKKIDLLSKEREREEESISCLTSNHRVRKACHN